MSMLVVDRQTVRIPPWVEDLKTFRRWTDCDDFPETGRICFFEGEVWVDMSKEQLFTHVQIKGQYTIVLGSLLLAVNLGYYFSDGVRLTNVAAGISACPDGTFVSRRTLRAKRARFVEGAADGYTELEGAADMVLEIISDSSVNKDTVILFKKYWLAGVREYWLVDARGEELRFEIYRRGPHGFVAASKRGGWVKSAVFAKSFKLTRRTDDLGHPDFRLTVR